MRTIREAVAMNNYETSATVQGQGVVSVAGVPFAIGTQVQVSISPLVSAASTSVQADSEDIFAEMRPFMVNVENVDDSREAVYTPLEGE
jgi:hypothetical protein